MKARTQHSRTAIPRLIEVDQSNPLISLLRRVAFAPKGDEVDVETSAYGSFGLTNYPGIGLIIRIGNHQHTSRDLRPCTHSRTLVSSETQQAL